MEVFTSPFSVDVSPRAEASVSTVFNAVAASVFRSKIVELRKQNPALEAGLTLKPDYDKHICWLSEDHGSGFAVSPDLELVNVFSTIKGRGRDVLKFALAHYSNLHLNCFADGREELFYKGHGFKIFRREPNWIAGQPDVIYMRHDAKLEVF